MHHYSFSKTLILILLLIFLLSFNLSAQEEISLVTAAGFGATREKALDQASLHAVINTAKKHFSANKGFAGIQNDVLTYIEENYADFVEDLSDVKVIKKYRRNKITARIPVNEAEMVSAVKAQFPDLES
ncbi:hypothetical protein ACFLZL_01010 [Thermodesulfobacteriota bacterium]